MSLKKKLGAGVATAVLGLGLIGGGVFAYFSDSEVTNNTFAAGTLDLAANPTTIIDVDNLKPGDVMVREFQLENNGTLDISTVDLTTAYNVTDDKGDNVDDFGKHIKVLFLENADKYYLLPFLGLCLYKSFPVGVFLSRIAVCLKIMDGKRDVIS